MNQFKTLAEWLRSFKQVGEAVDGALIIAGVQYVACRYTENLVAGPGCANPGPYTRETIIAVSQKEDRPTIKVNGKRKDRLAFQLAFADNATAETREWYCACYLPLDKLTEANKSYHPFGPTFQLSPWSVPGKMDEHERHPYTRVPAVFCPNHLLSNGS